VTAPLCPICGKPFEARFRPFCSKRCADIDLQRWFTGAYRIPGAALGDEGAEPGSDEDEP
jgi:endogenous inhibitor of DNA gyrase (YacG/DUF329 family)